MQKETLMETVASVGTSAPVETPASDLAANESLAAASDLSVPAAIPAVCVKIVTRLDALKEYVLGYMDTERYRNANPAESRPADAPVVLDEAEQVLSDLRRITGRAGLENGIAERERAAAFLEFPNSDAETLTPDGAVLDAIVANRKKIVTRLDALRQRMLDGMDTAQAGPILEDLRYVAEYTGLEDEIAMREEAAETVS